jgi:hypothetical protein
VPFPALIGGADLTGISGQSDGAVLLKCMSRTLKSKYFVPVAEVVTSQSEIKLEDLDAQVFVEKN